MAQRYFRRSIMLVSLIGAGACSDLVAPPSPSAVGQRGIAGPVQADSAEPAAIPRFTIQVDASGPFTPGSTVRLRARVRANLVTRAARLRIAVPEIEAARVHNFTTMGRVAGFHVPALRTTEQSLGEGQEVVFAQNVKVPVSGYFRAVVSAQADSGETISANGKPIQNTVHQEVWFFVNPQGGRATPAFDASIVPDSLVPMPGLARLKPHLRKQSPRDAQATPSGAQVQALLPPGGPSGDILQRRHVHV
jgi:hypothetical protein